MLPIESAITRNEEIQQLAGQGFSEAQIELILRYREQYANGIYQDEPPEYRRLAFVRWLYTNGKIED
jgi:hypothetical protein